MSVLLAHRSSGNAYDVSGTTVRAASSGTRRSFAAARNVGVLWRLVQNVSKGAWGQTGQRIINATIVIQTADYALITLKQRL